MHILIWVFARRILLFLSCCGSVLLWRSLEIFLLLLLFLLLLFPTGEREVMGSIPGRDIPKSFKWYSLLLAWHSDLRGRASAGRPSVRIIWLGVVSCKCLGHDTSVRQHYKSEHWAPCRNQTLSWYDWTFVESDVKSEQTTTKKIDAKHQIHC